MACDRGIEKSDEDFGGEPSVDFEAEGIAKVVDAIAKRMFERLTTSTECTQTTL